MVNRIVIDAGHNGLTDPGAVFNGRRESDDALRLANAVGAILTRNGYDVIYTRTGDISQSVQQKAAFATMRMQISSSPSTGTWALIRNSIMAYRL